MQVSAFGVVQAKYEPLSARHVDHLSDVEIGLLLDIAISHIGRMALELGAGKVGANLIESRAIIIGNAS